MSTDSWSDSSKTIITIVVVILLFVFFFAMLYFKHKKRLKSISYFLSETENSDVLSNSISRSARENRSAVDIRNARSIGNARHIRNSGEYNSCEYKMIDVKDEIDVFSL